MVGVLTQWQNDTKSTPASQWALKPSFETSRAWGHLLGLQHIKTRFFRLWVSLLSQGHCGSVLDLRTGSHSIFSFINGRFLHCASLFPDSSSWETWTLMISTWFGLEAELMLKESHEKEILLLDLLWQQQSWSLQAGQRQLFLFALVILQKWLQMDSESQAQN